MTKSRSPLLANSLKFLDHNLSISFFWINENEYKIKIIRTIPTNRTKTIGIVYIIFYSILTK